MSVPHLNIIVGCGGVKWEVVNYLVSQLHGSKCVLQLASYKGLHRTFSIHYLDKLHSKLCNQPQKIIV